MSLLPQVNAYHTDGKGQYDYFFALANESAKQWALYPAISTVNIANHDIVSTNSITLSSQVITADADDIYVNGEALVNKSTLTSTITNWSLYPAVSDVNFRNFAILSTSSIQLDEVFITATYDEILINGVPIVTSTAFANISSITDWAYYEALSTVNMALNKIDNCIGIELNGNEVTSGVGNTIKVNGQNPVATWSAYQASGNVDMNNNNITQVGFISAVTVNNTSNVSQSMVTANARVNTSLFSLGSAVMKGVNISTLFASTITTPVLYTTSTFASNVILSNATNSNVLTTAGATLLYNGAVVNVGASGDVSQWALYNAVGTVRSHQGYSGQALECIGYSYFNGNVQFRQATGSTTPTVEFNRSSATPQFKINTGEFLATGSSNLLGNKTTYTTQTYIAGGCTIDGGNLHGCSIGCLPLTTGINSMRIDVLPAGILLTSPTTIGILATSYSFNVTGSANMAAGGAIAIAAGSYITLEHGFGAGANGVYVQVAGRNDTARLLLEFGGSVGPSIDNPSNPAKVDYHGQNLFIQTITNTAAGNRWPRTPDIFIDSVSTLKFINGVGMIATPNYGLTITGNVGLSTLTSKTINTYNISTVNLYVESLFTPPGIGQINVYDPLALSQTLTVQQSIFSPKINVSSIYGVSGGTPGKLFLEATQLNVMAPTSISSATISSINGFVYPPPTSLSLNQSGYVNSVANQTVTTIPSVYLSDTFTATTTGHTMVTGVVAISSGNAANWTVSAQIGINGTPTGYLDSIVNTGTGHIQQITTTWRAATVAGTSYTFAVFISGSATVNAAAIQGNISFISGLI